jgi:hypothetical protein
VPKDSGAVNDMSYDHSPVGKLSIMWGAMSPRLK